MSADESFTLTAEIKTRLPLADRQAIERIARERHLKVSDIVREALREFLAARALESASA